MNVTPLGQSASVSPESTGAAPAPVTSAQMRQLAQAVSRVNQSGALSNDRELSLSLDPSTRLPVVKVLDLSNGEVVEQIPAEYLLRITSFLETEASQEQMIQKMPE